MKTKSIISALAIAALSVAGCQGQEESNDQAAALLALQAPISQDISSMQHNVGGINVSWRESRCKSGKEPGTSPRWTGGSKNFWGKWSTIYKNAFGSWDRGTVCETRLPGSGRIIFHDGCSGQAPTVFGKPPRAVYGSMKGTQYDSWGKVFHAACVIHDMCYHHNGGTYGYSRSTCDSNFLRDMQSICDQSFSSKKKFLRRSDRTRCRQTAAEMKVAVSVASSKHYNAFNYYAPYKSMCPSGKRYDLPSGTCR